MHRSLLALAIALTQIPSASAGGLSAPSLEVAVDAPLVTPVALTLPLAPDPRAAESVVETGTPPPLPAAPEPAPDEPLALPAVEVAVSPPRPYSYGPHAGKLARVEASDAGIGARVAPQAPARLAPEPSAAPLALSGSGPASTSGSSGAASPRAPSGSAATVAGTERAPEPPARAGPAAAAWVAASILLLLAPLALYHRLRGPELVEGPRARLLDLLRERPGIGPTEIARTLGVDPTTATYHLRRLARDGLVVAEGSGRTLRWFVAGSCAPEERTRVCAERGGGAVLEALRAAPGASKSEIARQLAISRSTVQWHLSSLARAGLVRYERRGARVLVFPITFS